MGVYDVDMTGRQDMVTGCTAGLGRAGAIKLAGEMNTVAPVGIRLNPDVDPKTHRKTTTGKMENKFGVDFNIAGEIVRDMGSFASVKLKSLGMHLGSPINTINPY